MAWSRANRGAPGVRWARWFAVCVSACFLGASACGPKPNAGDAEGTEGGRILREIGYYNPANLIKASGALSEAAQALSALTVTLESRLNDIDFEQINATVTTVRDLVAVADERVQQIPPDLGERVVRQVEAAKLDELSEKIQSLADVLRRDMESLRADQIAPALEELQRGLVSIRGKIDQIDVPEVNESVSRINVASSEFNETMIRINMPLLAVLWLTVALLTVLLLVSVAWLIRLTLTVRGAPASK